MWPQLLQVDPTSRSWEVAKKWKTPKQPFAEGALKFTENRPLFNVLFNGTLTELFFVYYYAKGMFLPSSQQSTEWVKRLPDAVSAPNNEVTRLIKEKGDAAKSPTPYSRPSGVNEKNVPFNVNVGHLLQTDDSKARLKELQIQPCLWKTKSFKVL